MAWNGNPSASWPVVGSRARTVTATLALGPTTGGSPAEPSLASTCTVAVTSVPWGVPGNAAASNGG